MHSSIQWIQSQCFLFHWLSIHQPLFFMAYCPNVWYWLPHSTCFHECQSIGNAPSHCSNSLSLECWLVLSKGSDWLSCSTFWYHLMTYSSVVLLSIVPHSYSYSSTSHFLYLLLSSSSFHWYYSVGCSLLPYECIYHELVLFSLLLWTNDDHVPIHFHTFHISHSLDIANIYISLLQLETCYNCHILFCYE